MNKTSWRLRRLSVMAMLVALSFVSVALVRVPVVLFLSYEPKDVLLTIGGFLFGPIPGILMAIVVALLELVTISSTGVIGLIMNIVSSGLFVGVSSLIYHKKRTLSGAVIGLVVGAFCMAIGMVLWNHLITPLYMDVSREVVSGMLLTTFAPFNLLKGGINAALTMVLYKGVSSALRSAHLLPHAETTGKKTAFPIWPVALFVFATLVLILLIWKGII